VHAAPLLLLIAGSFVAAGAKDSAAGATNARTDFTVSATVRAVADIELQSAPTNIKITAADVESGFVDVAQPTRLVIHSNSPSGFALEVRTLTPMLSSMVVHGLDADLSLGAAGGTIVQRWRSPRVVDLSLKFRFALAPGLKAGSYPWPLRMAVRPLESI